MPGGLVRAPLPEMLGPWLTWAEITTLQRAARTLHFSLLPEWNDFSFDPGFGDDLGFGFGLLC